MTFLAHRNIIIRYAVISLWFAFLLVPFRGPADAGILCAVIFSSLVALRLTSGTLRSAVAQSLSLYSRATTVLTVPRYYRYLVLLPLLTVPFFAEGYIIDVAILSGIYVILALGLNVVVGFTGLLNLGFVAFYAIGAYSFALLNTKLGLGFWSALPLSVFITTIAGYLLAVPALRLRGDYLAIVTLGFGEIVRLVLNNWDSLTRGPNGISGITSASLFSIPVTNLSHFYFFVLFFVCLAVFVMRRVQASKYGRAWIAIREDEIAASAMGVNTTLYKLYACAFGAFWAGIAGSLFATKMQFVSPESFTFMESVLILSMVILGGLGSIAGVVIGALILVFLPEALREIQLYRMLALGAGLVVLMVFRPQGLFGGRHASLGS